MLVSHSVRRDIAVRKLYIALCGLSTETDALSEEDVLLLYMLSKHTAVQSVLSKNKQNGQS